VPEGDEMIEVGLYGRARNFPGVPLSLAPSSRRTYRWSRSENRLLCRSTQRACLRHASRTGDRTVARRKLQPATGAAARIHRPSCR